MDYSYVLEDILFCPDQLSKYHLPGLTKLISRPKHIHTWIGEYETASFTRTITIDRNGILITEESSNNNNELTYYDAHWENRLPNPESDHELATEIVVAPKRKRRRRPNTAIRERYHRRRRVAPDIIPLHSKPKSWWDRLFS